MVADQLERSMNEIRTRYRLPLFALIFLLLGGSAALAQSSSKAAKPAYDKGVTEYNLGHFAEAIGEFEKAYELDRAPILLFNIAQSHRQLGNDERALFFYRRYLEQAPKDAANRPDVERRIKDLEDAVQQQRELKQKPPTAVGQEGQSGTGTAPQPPVSETPPASGARETGPAEDAAGKRTGQPAPAENKAPRRRLPIRGGIEAGPAFPSMAGSNTTEPIIFGLRAFGGYVIAIGRGAVDFGAAVTFSPLRYQGGAWSTFWGLFARAGGSYPVGLDGALRVIADLDLGVVWWGGLQADNPFTTNRVATTGAIPMPSIRFGGGVQYDVGEHMFVYVLPSYTFSQTTGNAFRNATTSVTRIDLPVGVGWTF